MMTSVTLCPSRPAHQVLKKETQFFHHPRAVGPAFFDGEGIAHSESRLAFEDCRNVNVTSHKLAPCRRNRAPEWALNPNLLRNLIVIFWENRAGIRGEASPEPNGNARTRLATAQMMMEKSVPALKGTLAKLCQEFTQCSDPVRKRVLSREIKTFDNRLVWIQRGPGLALYVVRLYYNLGYSSAQISDEIGPNICSPVHARQLIHRLGRLWNRIGGCCQRP